MKNMAIIAVVALLLLGGMGGGFFMLWSKISAMERTAVADTQPQADDERQPGPIYNLATLIVNLADKEGRRYLRTTMDLEIRDPEAEQRIVTRLPQIKDAAIKIISTRQFDDINTIEGKNGLRDEIIQSLNAIFKAEIVTNIYFSEFVIQ